MPTETVYGLAADATQAQAVARIFQAKGRPATNPVIVHVSSLEMARSCVIEWPSAAQMLAEQFWPGPLTLVLAKTEQLPAIVSAGGPTIGLRMPDQPVALGLIETLGRPVAAPSANRSTELSPTTAQHVLESLGDAIDLILDAGPTRVGIESTVVDLAGPSPVILRPGSITAWQIEQATGLHVAQATAEPSTQPARSPGLQARHYAPRTPVRLIAPGEAARFEAGDALLILGQPELAEMDGPRLRRLLATPEAAARELYRLLHEWDALKPGRIWVVMPPETAEWLAIRDRIRRAATPAE